MTKIIITPPCQLGHYSLINLSIYDVIILLLPWYTSLQILLTAHSLWNHHLQSPIHYSLCFPFLFFFSFFSRYYISYITFRLLCHHPPWQNSIRIWLQCGRPGFDSMPNHTSSSHTCIDIMFYGQTYVISCCQCNASYIGNLKAWYLYLTMP